MSRQLGPLWRSLVIVSISGIGGVGRLPVAMNECQWGAVRARGPEEEPILDVTSRRRSGCAHRYRRPSARRLGHVWLQWLQVWTPGFFADALGGCRTRGGRDGCSGHDANLGSSNGARRREPPTEHFFSWRDRLHHPPPPSRSLEGGEDNLRCLILSYVIVCLKLVGFSLSLIFHFSSLFFFSA